tara:strand:+ start:152 stop:304 length:153 start_codon:yes stop_codon:yes gene_type:complete
MIKREESKMTTEQLLKQVGSDFKRMTTFRWEWHLEPEYRVSEMKQEEEEV